MDLSNSSKVPTDDCFADLLIGDSALLLYYSESRTRSRNSTIILVYSGFVFFFFSVVIYDVCRKYSSVSGNGMFGLSEMAIIHEALVVAVSMCGIFELVHLNNSAFTLLCTPVKYF